MYYTTGLTDALDLGQVAFGSLRRDGSLLDDDAGARQQPRLASQSGLMLAAPDELTMFAAVSAEAEKGGTRRGRPDSGKTSTTGRLQSAHF